MLEYFSKESRNERREVQELRACKEIQRVLAQGVEQQRALTGGYDTVDLKRVVVNTGLSRALETRDCDFSLSSLGGVECITHTPVDMEQAQLAQDSQDAPKSVDVL